MSDCEHETVVCSRCGQVMGTEPTVAATRTSERVERVHERIDGIRQNLAARRAAGPRPIEPGTGVAPIDPGEPEGGAA